MQQQYFFKKDGNRMGDPMPERHSHSKASGSMPNVYGGNWQIAADILSGMAKPFGSIVKVVIIDSPTQVNCFDFTIHYDDPQSAKKLYDHVQLLRVATQSIIFSDFAHESTPPANNIGATPPN